MADLPDLTPAELAALAHKHGLRGPLERLPSAGTVNRAYANREVVLRVAVPGDETGEEDARTEAVAVPAALSTGLRTPPLLAFDDSRDVVDAPVTVYARVHAPSLHGTGWDVAEAPASSAPPARPDANSPACTSPLPTCPTRAAGWRSRACPTREKG